MSVHGNIVKFEQKIMIYGYKNEDNNPRILVLLHDWLLFDFCIRRIYKKKKFFEINIHLFFVFRFLCWQLFEIAFKMWWQYNTVKPL